MEQKQTLAISFQASLNWNNIISYYHDYQTWLTMTPCIKFNSNVDAAGQIKINQQL